MLDKDCVKCGERFNIYSSTVYLQKMTHFTHVSSSSSWVKAFEYYIPPGRRKQVQGSQIDFSFTRWQHLPCLWFTVDTKPRGFGVFGRRPTRLHFGRGYSAISLCVFENLTSLTCTESMSRKCHGGTHRMLKYFTKQQLIDRSLGFLVSYDPVCVCLVCVCWSTKDHYEYHHCHPAVFNKDSAGR